MPAKVLFFDCHPAGWEYELCVTALETPHFVSVELEVYDKETGEVDKGDYFAAVIPKERVDVDKLLELIEKGLDEYKRLYSADVQFDEILRKAFRELISYAVEHAAAVELGETFARQAPRKAVCSAVEDGLRVYIIDPGALINYVDEALELEWGKAVEAAKALAATA